MNDHSQDTYTLRWRGREFGPYSMEQINQKLDDHEIGMGHEILDQDKWFTLDEFFAALKAAEAAARTPAPAKPPPIPNLGSAASSTPPAIIPASSSSVFGVSSGERPASPPPPIGIAPTATAFKRAESSATPTQSPRHRLVYAILGILFGFLGVHNYYARHWLTGLLQLMLSIATTLLGFGFIASWLWALVEAVMVRRDGNGNEMI
jgi:TM2 domain-containing membrane protein YozV